MGYETKLIIGKAGFSSDEIKQGEPLFEDGEVYRPYLKDDKGAYIKTGRVETWFEAMIIFDLCKCGYDSAISAIDWENTDKSHFWYFHEGNERRTEDCYGKMSKPVPVSAVIEALQKDAKNDDYRRFRWALALLESMKDDDLQVLFYGH